jgi:glycosyltransferase involved in cell wall biosynthesis
MRIKLSGPVDDVTGYGEVARQIAFSLQDLGAKIWIKPRNWGYVKVDMSPSIKKRLFDLKKQNKVSTKGEEERALFVNVPTYFRQNTGKYAIGVTMGEVDGIPPSWAEYCNLMDTVFVPSSFSYQVFGLSGVETEKLKILPLGVDSDFFTPEGEKMVLEKTEGRFVFLSVGEWVPRKGFDLLLRAFAREFSVHDDVCLVLRCHSNSSDYDPRGAGIAKSIAGIVRQEKRKNAPRVELISQTLAASGMPSLYRSAQCFVQATRGEGWNMPVFEALACGVPVITTNWSAHTDYLGQDTAYLIEIEGMEAVPFSGSSLDNLYLGYRWVVRA